MCRTQHEPQRHRARAFLVMAVMAALLLAVTVNVLWLVAAAVLPVAALVLQEGSPERSATSTAATLAAAVGLILIGLGVAHN